MTFADLDVINDIQCGFFLQAKVGIRKPFLEVGLFLFWIGSLARLEGLQLKGLDD